MDSKGIKELHKRMEELHTSSLVARYRLRLETQCAIPPLVCVIFLFLSNPWCNYLLLVVVHNLLCLLMKKYSYQESVMSVISYCHHTKKTKKKHIKTVFGMRE